ncbi:hypothetical protein [Alicyclobacillus ferrooxydans]|uniref:hypothetical protein n=1 Tax=Alicyclobacillus ferrooxydans TaxID=471514 RepID=UPI000AE6FDE1|nr:hypothetical protein [Alicyclobacillus ferrooxydans]
MPRSKEPPRPVEASHHRVPTERDLWMSALRSAVAKPPWREPGRYRNSLLRG